MFRDLSNKFCFPMTVGRHCRLPLSFQSGDIVYADPAGIFPAENLIFQKINAVLVDFAD